MQARKIIDIFKVTTISSPSQKLFDKLLREAYFLLEDTAEEYVKDHPELSMLVTREKAFERGDHSYLNDKKYLAYNYYLLHPTEIEHTKKKDLRNSKNAWGAVLKDGIKHFIHFESTVESAIYENIGSVLILSKMGTTYATGSNKQYIIDYYDINNKNSSNYFITYLYVELSIKKGKLTEVRSFIDENSLIRVNTSVADEKLVKEKDGLNTQKGQVPTANR